MKKEFLEAGKIINTFGIRGELKVQPWSDRVDFLKQFKTIYISGQPVRVVSVRVHQQNALLTLEGVTDMDSALPYKNKIIEVRRADIKNKPGEHFVADLIGLEARDADSGEVFGKVSDVLSYPAQDLYEVKGGGKTYTSRMSPPLCRRSMKRKGLSPFMCWRAWANDVD